jgi:hypothetical protein
MGFILHSSMIVTEMGISYLRFSFFVFKQVTIRFPSSEKQICHSGARGGEWSLAGKEV